MNIRRLKHGFRIEEGTNTWHIVSTEGTAKIYTTLDKANGERILASLVVSRDLTERLYAEVRRSWKETSKFLNDELYAQDLTDALAMAAMASLLLAPQEEPKPAVGPAPKAPPTDLASNIPVCRGCGKPMQESGIMLTSFPPQYKFECRKCGTSESVRQQVPVRTPAGIFSLSEYLKDSLEAQKATKESDGPTFGSIELPTLTQGYLSTLATLSMKDLTVASYKTASGQFSGLPAYEEPTVMASSYSTVGAFRDRLSRAVEVFCGAESFTLPIAHFPVISCDRALEVFRDYPEYSISKKGDSFLFIKRGGA